jgi:hypothetical protein
VLVSHAYGPLVSRELAMGSFWVAKRHHARRPGSLLFFDTTRCCGFGAGPSPSAVATTKADSGNVRKIRDDVFWTLPSFRRPFSTLSWQSPKSVSSTSGNGN